MTMQSAVLEAPTFAKPKVRYTVEEYLAQEETAEYKSEYHDGEIVPMTGGSINHSRIIGNVYVQLFTALQNTDCEAFMSDMRLWIPAHNRYTYPDITVICGEPLFYADRTDTITNPALIVEVLSPSTEDYDRGSKFQYYRSPTSLHDYLLIHQDSHLVEHFHKLPDGRWMLSDFQDQSATIALSSLGADLAIERIYDRVDWAESA